MAPRIKATKVPANYQALEGSERRPTPGARLIGPANPNETFSVTIVLRRRSDGPAMPDHNVLATTPLAERGRMANDEFAANYGATPDDIKKVTDFVAAQGLKVNEANAARRTVVASGTAAQMSKAFAVTLARYQHEIVGRRGEKPETETYRGRDGFVHVPGDLAGIIVGVFGLDNRTITKRNGADPPNTTTLTVPQVARLYNYPTNSAAGQTIGIFSLSGYDIHDIQLYFAGLPAGYTMPTVNDVLVHGTNSGSDPYGETTQDIGIAASFAPGSAISVYITSGTQQGWVDLISRVAHPNAGDAHCSVLSSSWYVANGDDAATLANEGISTAFVNAVSAAFLDAAAQGVTVCIASGDTGSDSKVGDGRAHVQYPGSDPSVLAVGGTTIGNINGLAFDEYVWNDPAPGDPNHWGTTGGGVSDHFGLPAYQNGAGIPRSINDNHVGRGVPDVAGNASLNSGYSGLFLGGGAMIGNGTSASAPQWAGLIAVINAALGESVGFVNPAIYALGSSGFRDINPPPGPTNNGNGGVAGYPAGPGWDACTGWGSPNGAALLAGLQQIFAKDCVFITDRNTFGKDEIDAMLHLGNPATIPAAFYIQVDGFRANELGIGMGDLAGVPSVNPTIVPHLPVSGMTIGDSLGRASALIAQDPSLPPSPQRFTWVFPVSFTSTAGFVPGGQTITLTASINSVSGSADIQLNEVANVYEVDGAVAWLSSDTRVFMAKEGESWFNAPTKGTTTADTASFIKAIINNLNTGNTGGQTFDSLDPSEGGSTLALYQFDHNSKAVFNFALSRVRYRALNPPDPTNVRVFFRLCPALSVSVDYDLSTTYRRSPGLNPDGQPIPVLGVESGNIVTIPFFAEDRQNTSAVSMDQQTDPANVQTVPHDASGHEVERYFGCWLDINQPLDGRFPLNPSGDGPYSGILQSVFDLVRNQHQCMLTEIAFDSEPISGNPSPAMSDKLAQRNLALSPSDNPGDIFSRRISNTFELKATPLELAAGEKPDELLIDWGNTPAGSMAQIYIPSVIASEILEMADKMYTARRLTKADDHTIQCQASGMTYVPIPPGTDLNYAALLTVDLPEGIRRGQLIKIIVRQVTNAVGLQHGKSPVIKLGAEETAVAVTQREIRWRRVRGTVQISIPVSSRELLLEAEEQLLSMLRWIEKSIPAHDRWYLVFRRYVEQIAQRVQGFGGDPGLVPASPTGQWHPAKPSPVEARIAVTGKIAGLFFDHFGDFVGFLLEAEEGEHRFECRDKEIEELAERAWSERLRLTVWAESDEPHRPLSFVVHEPPAPFRH